MCTLGVSTTPPHVRMAIRTLQYLVLPLLSLALLVLGLEYEHSCPENPRLPYWHQMAGAFGLVVPFLYFIFDVVTPAMSRRFLTASTFLDYLVVLLVPVYALFGFVFPGIGIYWLAILPQNPQCDKSVIDLTYLVNINFIVHLITPFVFYASVCISRQEADGRTHCLTNLKEKIEQLSLKARMSFAWGSSFPLAAVMVVMGFGALSVCEVFPDDPGNNYTSPMSDMPEPIKIDNMIANTDAVEGNITMYNFGEDFYQNHSYFQGIRNSVPLRLQTPVWLIIGGVLLGGLSFVYLVYDKFCKEKNEDKVTKTIARVIVFIYLAVCLFWTVVAFLWNICTPVENSCGGLFLNKFAFACLIYMDIMMDLWICFKLCVVFFWSLE